MKRKAEEKAKKALEKAKKAEELKIQAKQKKNTRSTPASAVDTGRKRTSVSSAASTSSSRGDHLPRTSGLTNTLATALILIYAACASKPMRTISWKERVRNGFPVHVGDGCMKNVVKIV